LNVSGRFKNYYSRVMDLPDAPIKVARGAAFGFALDFLPLPLISIPIAYLLARVVGGNGIAAALTAAFFKWAVPLFYFLNMATGQFILGFTDLDIVEPVMQLNGVKPVDWMDYLTQLGYHFMAGAVINSILAWLLIYLLVKKIMFERQKRKRIL